MTLAEVNHMPAPAFVAALGHVFENSPWVAERVGNERPFASVAALHAAMMRKVRDASHEERLALIRAHPELAGREAAAGTLTADSTSEQARLGFTSLTSTQHQRVAEANRRYRSKFGFPCIVALRRHGSRESVIEEMEHRLANDAETELAAAIEQIGHITRGRLDRLIQDTAEVAR